MTNSLADLMANKWEEPAEIRTIKDFVRDKYKAQVGVKLSDKTITISAPNAALAGALRMDIHKLQKEVGSTRKLVIRIGGLNVDRNK